MAQCELCIKKRIKRKKKKRKVKKEENERERQEVCVKKKIS